MRKPAFDSRRLCETAAALVAKELKDYCLVQLLSDDGRWLVAEAVFSPEEGTLEDARRSLMSPVAVAAHPMSSRVIETEQPLQVTRPQLEKMRVATSPLSSAAQFGQCIGVHSMMLLPLRVDGRIIGQLTLARYRADRPPFDERDLELAQARIS